VIIASFSVAKGSMICVFSPEGELLQALQGATAGLAGVAVRVDRRIVVAEMFGVHIMSAGEIFF